MLHVDDLTVHLMGEDDAIVATTTRLIKALTMLRDNADVRLAESAAAEPVVA